jgi:hypothetical protein
MQDNPSPRRRERRSPPSTERDDAAVQRAVLAFVLAAHPTRLTISDLARELCERPEDFAAGDALERAVRDLVGAGLLHRHDAFVLPTRAALHFDRLALD